MDARIAMLDLAPAATGTLVGMDLITIGAFARSAGLTTKALRLYDDLGLLRPAAVDGRTGYRYYETGQLDRARLIAKLRAVGMPLARIADVCALPPAAAAAAIRTFWSEVETGVAERARLAHQLFEEIKIMTKIRLRYAASTETGIVRPTNEDAAYASGVLLAVADGVGGVPGGAEASTAAVNALRTAAADGGVDLATLVELGEKADAAARPHGVTTLTALIRTGDRLGLVHIGDSRAYLLRNGDLSRLTQDHSTVQNMVDAGTLLPGEAASHPQRPMLARALGAHGEADVSIRSALPGDRYLLCTDGLWAEVPPADLAEALPGGDPAEAVTRLLALALTHGAPDNVAVVVADVTD